MSRRMDAVMKDTIAIPPPILFFEDLMRWIFFGFRRRRYGVLLNFYV